MSNEPKCVYIKTEVGYVQITYAEFCRIRNTTENYKASHWFIPVQGVLLEVPKDAYKAFYREKERERYLRKLDSALFLCNLDLKSEEIPLRDENTDIEQQTEDRLMIEKMYSCLHLLDPDDAECRCRLEMRRQRHSAHGDFYGRANHRFCLSAPSNRTHQLR